MRSGFQDSDTGSLYGGESVSGTSSFRRSRFGGSPDRRSCISSSSRSIGHSRSAAKGLKYYLKTLVDLELFSNCIGDWILDRTSSNASNQLFKSPFTTNELQNLDYALEGVLFQQLFRMSNSQCDFDESKEVQYLALEDFLHTAVNGLWRTFWHKSGPLPFTTACPRYPRSKFYTVGKAVTNGRLEELSGMAVALRNENEARVQWDHVLEFALFKHDIVCGADMGFSASIICEALFYGVHILLSRSLATSIMTESSCVHLLVLDSMFGGVIKFQGDLSKLDINSKSPYTSIGEWIKCHTEISVSPVDRVWNKLGNPTWGDVGTLQLLMATFNSIAECIGPPRKSIELLAADHNLRLQRRQIECHGLVSARYKTNHDHNEILENGEDIEHSDNKEALYLTLKPGDMVLLEGDEWNKGFQIKDILPVGNYLSYCAVSLDNPSKPLMLLIGSHSSKLEPSWEAMGLWYHVQRQTKVLNIMKQRGISNKHLPEITASGRVQHPGPCEKQNLGDRCDHILCGTPVLVTSPVGETILSVIARDGPFSSEDALRCCRDCLIALKTAAQANVQHGDVCPENIVRVLDRHATGSDSVYYVPVAWGHAILEDRDSPAMNLQFSSIHALQYRKCCPSSDIESLIYVLYFACGGAMQQQDSIESALQWREQSWAKRVIQQRLGEVSALLKAFADYVDSLCGTPYPVDYDIWLSRLNKSVSGFDKGKKFLEHVEGSLRLEDVAESSGTSGGTPSIL